MRILYKFSVFGAILGLLMSLGACKFIKNLGGGGKEPRLDTIITRKDTSKVVVPIAKVDTFKWCDTLPEKNGERAVVCYEKVGTVTTKRDTINRIKVANVPAKDTSKPIKIAGFTPEIKSSYNVVIALPFMTGVSRTGEAEAKSLRAMDFYEGVQLAFDSLKREGVNLNISVFDTQDSDSMMQTLIVKDEMLKADVVMGGVSTAEVRALSNFAKAYQKTFISPINPRDASGEDNPFFVQVNPTFGTHARHIFKYLDTMSIRKPKNIILVAPQDDSAAVRMFQAEYALYKNDVNAKVQEYLAVDNKFSGDALKGKTQSGALNIVVVPTVKENFVYSLARSLGSTDGTVRDNYIVFGLSQWKYFEMVEAKHFESLRIHLTTECFADMTDPKIVRYKEAYMANYGLPPRDFGFTGFDVMLYVGRMLKKHGTGFRDKLATEPYKGRHTTFRFAPVQRVRNVMDGGKIKSETVINRYENNFINIIKYEQYTFKKIGQP